MARPYSYDLRQKAVEAVLNGAKLVEVSEWFGMSIRTVQRWLKMWSESGDYRPKQNYSLLSAYGIQLNPTCRESIILSLENDGGFLYPLIDK